MLSIIGTAIFCIVGVYIIIDMVFLIYLELTTKTCSFTAYFIRLVNELSLDEFWQIGFANVLVFAVDVSKGEDFDWCYDHYISKVR